MNNILKSISYIFLNYEFVFIFFFFSTVFFILTTYIKKQTFRIVLLGAFSVFLSLAICEYILSFKDSYSTPWFFTIKHIENINAINITFDKGINNRRFTNNLEKEEDVVYSQYDNKLRYTKGKINSENTYVFLGCSFVFGTGLNDENTVTYYFSKLMNFTANVINCGIPGHSINTSKYILNNDLVYDLCPNKKINHFFYFLIYDHIPRNFRILDPSDNMLYENGKYSRVKQPLGIFKIIFAKSYIFNKIFLPVIEQHNTLFYEEYMIESFESINKIIEDKYSSKLTIIIWPEFDQAFIDKLNNKNFDVIVLPEYFNSETSGCKIPNDGHPTAKANKEIAQILYNHINKTNAAN